VCYNKGMKDRKKHANTKHRLEDYEPGATPSQVLKALKKVAKTPKPSDKPS
jgi:hypothetical protein